MTALETLTGSSLSPRWVSRVTGLSESEINRMSEDGRLLVVRPDGSRESLVPLWQLGDDGRPLASVPLILEEARRAGLDAFALQRLLERRVGLTDSQRLADVLRAGRVEAVLSAIRAAAVYANA